MVCPRGQRLSGTVERESDPRDYLRKVVSRENREPRHGLRSQLDDLILGRCGQSDVVLT